ncbi:MAG TPA: hypothetical protein VF245_10445 [Solirubrobacterales bacterium]
MNVSAQQSPPVGSGRYEPCEECGAPLDPQQRYCIQCAARRGNGANPSSRYFAAMSKRAHRKPLRPPAKAPSSSRAAAVGFFALLPIAVAIGVVVGRSGAGNGSEEALLEALRKQPAVAPSTTGASPTTASTAKKGKAAKGPAKDGGKVVAHTSNGDVHQIAGFKPPPEKVKEDTRLVEENPEQVGSSYIEAQQNLPDVVVIGGDPGSAPAPSGKAGEP